MKIRYLIIVTLAATLVLGIRAAGAQKASPLDGKEFEGSTVEKGKTSGAMPEQIRFAKGSFRSLPCDAYGFGDAPYSWHDANGSIEFHAVTKSEKEGEMDWSGQVKGTTLMATAIWKKSGQKTIEYQATAKEKK
jgi:hypothetical protein